MLLKARYDVSDKRNLLVVPVEFSALGLPLQYIVFVSSYLFNFGGRGLSCDLSSLTDLRRIIDSRFIQHFLFCVDGSDL